MDGRQNHLRDVAGGPVSCPQSRERMVHHHFIAVLAGQVRSRSWEIVQVDTPRKASRYFRYDGRLRSVHQALSASYVGKVGCGPSS